MKRILSCLLVSLTISGSALLAQNPLKTHTVSIFKNGTAFFVRSGEVKLQDGHYKINEQDIPRALFGSLWFHAPGQENYSVRRVQDTVRQDLPIEAMILFPKENVGKRIRFIADKEMYQGEIISASREMVVIKSSEYWMSIPTKSISMLQFLDEPKVSYESKSLQKSLQLDFPRKNATQALEMMYLQQGLGWFPSYLLELVDEEKARLTFRSEIVNDAEDIENASINFVVGVPNFRYANLGETPLVNAWDVQQIMSMLAAGEGYRGRAPEPQMQVLSNMSNSMQGIRYDNEASFAPNFTPMPVNNAAEGQSLEDLYFYRVDGITLPKGGRAYYNILTAEVPIAHIYECQVNGNAASSGYYQQLRGDSEFFEVTHKLKVKNSTEQPFTTGVAFVSRIVDGTSNPVSQDQLTYTAVGAETYLKITSTPDIQVSHEEEEAGIELNAKKVRKVNYDLITVSGTVSVKNYKDKDVSLNVRRTIVGNLIQSKPDWLKSVQVNLSRSLNATTDVCWELKLKAGEEQTVEYRYQVYVAN